MVLCQVYRCIPIFIPQEGVYVVGEQSLAALHVSILGCIMQGSPSPRVSHDGGTHEQEPVENRCVAPPSCKVQGSGSFIIPCCQADVCECHL